MIEKGVNVDIAAKWGAVPLIEAAKSGDLRIVKLLIDAWARIDTVDTNGETALIKAAESGSRGESPEQIRAHRPDGSSAG